MSEHNKKTIDMYNSGGAIEYIGHNDIDPETEKWERLFNYVAKELQYDKRKKIIEFGSGCGQLASMLQKAGYDLTSTDIVDAFMDEQKRRGIKVIKKYNFLSDDFDEVFDSKADLIISWRNPHLDMDDMRKLFKVTYNGLNEDGLFIINFQNADVHQEAEILPNGTKYNYKILEDKQTNEKRFYAYFTKKDIDELRKELFDIVEYHNEGGKKQKNWHVLTLRKIGK
ncbi:MAG: class I SAM-dependent methyltransferase [Clostridia bacterium]|nr:class I SAM-dependent methyltransferase [Clostridia bacterium]